MQEPSRQLDYTPTTKSIDRARSEARDLSSYLLDSTGIEGEISEPGPGVSVCEADPNDVSLYTMRHPWTIYGVAVEVLERGRDNLREQLLQDGWEILVDEEMNNQDRTPRLLFESRETEYALDVRLTHREGNRPQLVITAQSACFRTPEGETREGEY
ncbi:hypothetical protein RM780_25605 [Streptomyces sp. DSM 44917]|uniref:Uncharacterized protein n=1 Tax=Streptomyces boetiae TaxID=3075541 RepID=A0ABU2LFE8_9ACTN|nr:hypothetical protein [Streptomyces sp. DSM 44917]MDT0310299.1 hypothetical protein [Streptomyces sp. DSM 44917]